MALDEAMRALGNLPLSENIEDRRNPGLLEQLLAQIPPGKSQLGWLFGPQGTPVLPQGPLSRAAGYDNIGK
jgi:hypothetical protein